MPIDTTDNDKENNKYSKHTLIELSNLQNIEIMTVSDIGKAANDEFKKDTTYINCNVGWVQWGVWLGDISGSATEVEYIGATVTINKTGKMAKIVVLNKDGELRTYNKRVSTKGFYFKEMKTNSILLQEKDNES